jgi:very-short-patch-repair endonuclease
MRIAVEYDGKLFHSTDEQKAADRKRRKVLRDAGWIVIVVGSEDFAGAALDAWLGELREAIAERGPRAQRRYARAAGPRPRKNSRPHKD